jgi:hypothetical protein
VKPLVDLIKKYPALYEFLRFGVYARVRSASREKIFRDAYEKNLWNDKASASGPGSNLQATENIRLALPALLTRLGVTSLLDIPCGDFHWMKSVDLGPVKYTGADLVAPLIEKNRELYGIRGDFVVCDLLKDSLPAADMILCRDCLVHLSLREVDLAIRNIAASDARLVALTTFPELAENVDTVTPYWRALNFSAQPFLFPEPVEVIRDFSDTQVNDQGKFLGVWKVSELRSTLARTDSSL